MNQKPNPLQNFWEKLSAKNISPFMHEMVTQAPVISSLVSFNENFGELQFINW